MANKMYYSRFAPSGDGMFRYFHPGFPPVTRGYSRLAPSGDNMMHKKEKAFQRYTSKAE